MGVLDIPRELAAARARLRQFADRERGKLLQSFFKTGPGEYAEGDLFLGVRVPAIRKIAREFRAMSMKDIRALLASKWHEDRMLALVILVHQYEKGSDAERDAIYRLYLRSAKSINNWDLVDTSAPRIVGAHLLDRDRAPLYRLARSRNLWERRIALLGAGKFDDDIFAIVTIVLNDPHDLIHKAAGWMLREAGKRDRAALENFLQKHAPEMPRTMLRYAIERFPPALRKKYLAA